MFICWFGELMGDDMDEMAKLNNETLDMMIDITYDETKKYNNWFEV